MFKTGLKFVKSLRPGSNASKYITLERAKIFEFNPVAVNPGIQFLHKNDSDFIADKSA